MTQTLETTDPTGRNAIELTNTIIAPGQLIIINTIETYGLAFVALKGFNPLEQFTKELKLTTDTIDSVGDFIDILCAKGFMTELNAVDIFEYCI